MLTRSHDGSAQKHWGDHELVEFKLTDECDDTESKTGKEEITNPCSETVRIEVKNALGKNLKTMRGPYFDETNSRRRCQNLNAFDQRQGGSDYNEEQRTNVKQETRESSKGTDRSFR